MTTSLVEHRAPSPPFIESAYANKVAAIETLLLAEGYYRNESGAWCKKWEEYKAPAWSYAAFGFCLGATAIMLLSGLTGHHL